MKTRELIPSRSSLDALLIWADENELNVNILYSNHAYISVHHRNGKDYYPPSSDENMVGLASTGKDAEECATQILRRLAVGEQRWRGENVLLQESIA